MKVRILVATLAAVLTAGVVSAQTAPQGQVPAGEAALGSVSLPRSVMADGKALKAGTYQVRLTAQAAAPAVPGQTMERWVEFLQGGKVVGREVSGKRTMNAPIAIARIFCAPSWSGCGANRKHGPVNRRRASSESKRP